MNIYLAYIEGISRIDTPYFTSGSEQETYFDNKVVETIETTFYPPHYHNAINVSSDECDINTSINYLFFEYKNKRYYYFIDSITYSSESVITLNITMDYIQTYMFNIYIQNGIINRRFIDRFLGSRINRAYIRENVSKGELELVSSDNDIIDTTPLWIIIKSTHRINTFSQRGDYVVFNNACSAVIQDFRGHETVQPYY